jgi:hypothetical protein
MQSAAFAFLLEKPVSLSAADVLDRDTVTLDAPNRRTVRADHNLFGGQRAGHGSG